MRPQDKISSVDAAWVSVITEMAKLLSRDHQASLLIYLIEKKECLEGPELPLDLHEFSDILTRLSEDVFGVLIDRLYRLLYPQTEEVIYR